MPDQQLRVELTDLNSVLGLFDPSQSCLSNAGFVELLLEPSRLFGEALLGGLAMGGNAQKIYRGLIPILAISYFGAASFHLLDVFDLRLHFSQMDLLEKTWTLYSLFADILVGIALVSRTRAGELLFVTILLAKIAVYLGWSDALGNQYGWVGFHLATLGAYLVFLTNVARPEPHLFQRE